VCRIVQESVCVSVCMYVCDCECVSVCMHMRVASGEAALIIDQAIQQQQSIFIRCHQFHPIAIDRSMANGVIVDGVAAGVCVCVSVSAYCKRHRFLDLADGMSSVNGD